MNEKFLEVLKSHYIGNINEIKLDNRLKEDLGFDSLTLVGLIVDIEEALNFEFDDAALDPSKLITLQDLVNLL